MLLKLVALRFVHFASLEDLEGFLFQGGFAGSVAHLGETLLMRGEFSVELGEFDVEGFDVRVCLLKGVWSVLRGVECLERGHVHC